MKTIYKLAVSLVASLPISNPELFARPINPDIISNPLMINTYNISYSHQEFNGIQVLRLGQKMKQDFGIELADLRIAKIELFAKSKMGGGSATLVMDQVSSPAQNVPGRANNFNNNAPHTYTNLEFEGLNEGYVSNQLQIRLSGNIKVQKVVIYSINFQEPQPTNPTDEVMFYERAGCKGHIATLDMANSDAAICSRVSNGLSKLSVSAYKRNGVCVAMTDSIYDACTALLPAIPVEFPVQPIIGFHTGINCTNTVLNLDLDLIDSNMCAEQSGVLGRPQILSISVGTGCKNLTDSFYDSCFGFN